MKIIGISGSSRDNSVSVTKQPDLVEAAQSAGKLLGDRLRNDHDRKRVAEKMQQKLMAMFAAST